MHNETKVDIENAELNKEETCINFNIGAVKTSDFKTIHIEVIPDTIISIPFYHHSELKISKAEPKAIKLSSEDSNDLQIKISLKDEIPCQNDHNFIIDSCFVEIEANDKKEIFNGTISNEDTKLLVFDCSDPDSKQILESMGACKKAKLRISLNKQQWFACKPTIAIE